MADGTFPDGVNSDVSGQTWTPSGVTNDGDAAMNTWKNGEGDGQGWKNVFAPKDNDGDGSDAKPPPDVKAPTLTLKDSAWPLPATGKMTGGGGGGTPPTTAPDVPDFSVTVETLRDAQSAMLPSANTATTKYNSLKDSTNAKKSWIFQQASADQDTTGVVIYAGTTGNDYGPDTGKGASNLDPDLVKQTPIMTASLDNALLAIADAVHLAGEYASFLNTAAQSYTYADKESYLKAPNL
jgi:hypothetical protein